MSVSREDVLRVAALARIDVPPDRVDALVAELTTILDHVDVLAALDAPAPSAGAEGMRLAADEPPAEALLRRREDIAPMMRDGFYLVPRLATHDDGTGAA